jgi:phospholipid transport system substrate-binding protein
MKKINPVLTVAAILVLLAAPHAYASQPLDTIKKPVDSVITILRDPSYRQSETKDQMREKIRSEINPVFDFTEMAKRTLARNWNDFSADEQKLFARVFGRLLEDTYIDKVVAGFKDEEVVYLEEQITDRKAVVQTKILRNNAEIPVDYSLIKSEAGWRIYDVRIEGVSLVKNYRSQFRRILRKSSPSGLIKRIEEKIEELNKSRASQSKTSFDHALQRRSTIVFLKSRSPLPFRL